MRRVHYRLPPRFLSQYGPALTWEVERLLAQHSQEWSGTDRLWFRFEPPRVGELSNLDEEIEVEVTLQVVSFTILSRVAPSDWGGREISYIVQESSSSDFDAVQSWEREAYLLDRSP